MCPPQSLGFSSYIQLRSECERLQRHASTSGEWTSEAASLDFAKSSLPSGAHPVKGERLGGTSERSRLHQFTGSGDAARNAIAAVTSSAGAREDGSGARTPDLNGVGAAARQFRKDDAVLYTQRDGSQVPAKVRQARAGSEHALMLTGEVRGNLHSYDATMQCCITDMRS